MSGSQEVFAKQRAHHSVVRQTRASERVKKLERLQAAIRARESEIEDAIAQDFHKCRLESFTTELVTTHLEINMARRSLKKWMRPKPVPTPIPHWGTRGEIRAIPKGVVLIVSPWNYPFSLTLHPLIAAVAAGNCIVVKPSEMTPHVSTVIARLLREVFEEQEVAVFEGGAEMTQELLALPFDHFFFTGSTKVGQIVAEAAAKHLATSTLELGGKSPTFIDRSADLRSAAKRIAWGKFINASQTCVAPDYVLVPEELEGGLVAELTGAIGDLYGATPEARRSSPDYARIINDRNFGRIKGLLDGSVNQGATVAFGGASDAASRYIEPTVLTGVRPEMPVMQEEIFGPLLPLVRYKTLDEALALVNKRDRPLASYIFSNDRAVTERILGATYSGGSAINTTILHMTNSHLPFGGVGASGNGNYHGHFGFKTFSHERAVLRQGRILDLLRMLYPPYTGFTRRLLELIARLPG